MEVTAVLVVMTAIFVWGAFSVRLTRSDLTAPIAFVAVGALLGALDLIAPSSARHSAISGPPRSPSSSPPAGCCAATSA